MSNNNIKKAVGEYINPDNIRIRKEVKYELEKVFYGFPNVFALLEENLKKQSEAGGQPYAEYITKNGRLLRVEINGR